MRLSIGSKVRQYLKSGCWKFEIVTLHVVHCDGHIVTHTLIHTWRVHAIIKLSHITLPLSKSNFLTPLNSQNFSTLEIHLLYSFTPSQLKQMLIFILFIASEHPKLVCVCIYIYRIFFKKNILLYYYFKWCINYLNIMKFWCCGRVRFEYEILPGRSDPRIRWAQLLINFGSSRWQELRYWNWRSGLPKELKEWTLLGRL